MKAYLYLSTIAAAAAMFCATSNRSAAQPQSDTPPAQSVVTDTVKINTSAGLIVVVLYGKDAPKTVANFVGLAKKGFYSGIVFHRVVPNFVIQAGDPLSKDTARRADWGTSGESIYGHEFEDELNPETPSYKRGYVEGTLAMANHGPNTNSSQFFITLKNVSLQKNYTMFGSVSQGMDIVHKIEAGPFADPRTGAPLNPVKIISMTATQTAQPTTKATKVKGRQSNSNH